MPSGKTHDRITLWSLPIVAGVSLTQTRSSSLTLAILSGYLFGALMLGPDLDTRSLHYKRWGILRWIWIPYRGSLAHRSPFSHGPLIGTVVRVLYVLVWAFLLGMGSLALINQVFQLGWTWDDIGGRVGRSIQRYPAQWLAIGLGLELGALSHYVADWGISSYKRVRKHYPTEGIRAIRRVVRSPTSQRRTSKKRKRRSPTSAPQMTKNMKKRS